MITMILNDNDDDKAAGQAARQAGCQPRCAYGRCANGEPRFERACPSRLPLMRGGFPVN